MKTSIKLMLMFAITIATASCQKEPLSIDQPEPPAPPSKEEMITVGFKLTGDIAIDETPMSRATSNDLYGVNILIRDANGYYNSRYAIGIFDDISLLSVDLPKKTMFAIQIFLVKDGKSKFPNGKDGVPTARPFELQGAMNSYDAVTLSMNKISYSRECYLHGGYFFDETFWFYPQLIVYSGYVTAIEAINQNELISIPMCKASFGINVTVKNLIEGDKVGIYLDAMFHDKPFYVTSTFQGVFAYTTDNIKRIQYDQITKEFAPYSQISTMRVDLIKANGTKTTILSKTMEYKRNVMHSFTLDIEELAPSTGTVDTPLEDTPMTDESVNL